MNSYFEEHSVLSDTQFGFRVNHTTQDALVSTVEDWRYALDKDLLVGSIMIDLSKAFDSVDHSILLGILNDYGVRNEESAWFRDYLSARQQRVMIGPVQSKWSLIKRGVPQGSILGPLLFTVYVNDLPDVVKDCVVKQYADDTTIYCIGNDPSALSRNLNSDICHVSEWFKSRRLSLNVSKTKCMFLSRRRREQDAGKVSIQVDGEAVSRSSFVKILGVIVDDHLSWKQHIDFVRAKCYMSLRTLKRYCCHLPKNLKKRIYQALILPNLDYCCVLWMECGKVLQQKVERIQNSAMRFIMDKPLRTSVECMRKDLVLLSLVDRREMFRVIFVYRCMSDLAPPAFSNLFHLNNKFGDRVTRGHNRIHIFPVNTDFRKKSVSHMGALAWNKLPPDVDQFIKTKNILNFKSFLKNYFYESCV